ncbi:NADH-quinone oxidoreductase subunit L, partial [Chloroflexota bacterium]
TAFYMFRVVFMTFGGEYRGGSPEAQGAHPHESPSVMVMPMVILAILAVVSGFWNVNGQFSAFMGHNEAHAPGFFGILTYSLPWISLILAGLGILLAYAMYSAKWISAERVGSWFKPLYTVFYQKYWFDELYENVIIKMALLKGLFAGFQIFDSKGVDEAVNGVATGVMAGGRVIRRAQTGQLQLYGLVIGIGILVIVLVLYFFG